MRGYRWTDDQPAMETMKKKVPQNVGDCFDLIEREYFKGPWVMGETYTISDPYLFTLAGWLEADGVDPKRFPKVLDHRNRMAERPAVKKVLARETPEQSAPLLMAPGLTVLVWGAAPAFIRSFSLATGPADAFVIRTVAVAAVSCCYRFSAASPWHEKTSPPVPHFPRHVRLFRRFHIRLCLHNISALVASSFQPNRC